MNFLIAICGPNASSSKVFRVSMSIYHYAAKNSLLATDLCHYKKLFYYKK